MFLFIFCLYFDICVCFSWYPTQYFLILDCGEHVLLKKASFFVVFFFKTDVNFP